MMVVGAYTLDLYCDNKHVKHPYGIFPDEFVGETYGECVAMARQRGWRVSHDRQRAICPICTKTPGAESRMTSRVKEW